MRNDESIVDWAFWLGSLVAGLLLAYFLAAPPVIIAACKQANAFYIPTVYLPVLRIIESDFGGPLVWYFNNVWNAGISLMGDESGPPWYMVVLYLAVGTCLLGVLLFPFIRLAKKRAIRQLTIVPEATAE